MTKDEKLLIAIYQQLENQDYVNPFTIGAKLGYKNHLVKNIVQGLMQANLVKRYSDEEIILTERGIEVAKSLI